jgi:hypothetical protein
MAPALASGTAGDDRAPDPPHETGGGGAAALPHGLIDRPAAKAE